MRNVRVALVAPANLSFMPYLDYYRNILDKVGCEYTIISWDRLGIKDNKNGLVFRDKKECHNRGLVDYLSFCFFVVRTLKQYDFNRVIVFGPQVGVFLSKYLQFKYKRKYIVDIRDYNRLLKYLPIKRLLRSSFANVISSPKYRVWLPESKYVVSHNCSSINFSDDAFEKPKKISISCIGALKDFDANIELFEVCGNSDWCELFFHGEGIINTTIVNYVKENKLVNVVLTGRYDKHEEEKLYKNSAFINMLMSDGLNNNTCLSNRLYNSVLFGRPLIAYSGSYLSDLIADYSLGVVIERGGLRGLKNVIEQFSWPDYQKGRIMFFSKVAEDESLFAEKVSDFVVKDLR